MGPQARGPASQATWSAADGEAVITTRFPCADQVLRADVPNSQESEASGEKRSENVPKWTTWRGLGPFPALEAGLHVGPSGSRRCRGVRNSSWVEQTELGDGEPMVPVSTDVPDGTLGRSPGIPASSQPPLQASPRSKSPESTVVTKIQQDHRFEHK